MSSAVAEIIAIGDELLLGDTVDTNGAWLGQRLSELGAVVAHRSVVGDDEAAIREALASALRRAPIVICCGGLGPTPDDRTRDAVSALYGRPSEIDASWLEVIRERFRRRGIDMPDVNRRQAMKPAGAVLFPNANGTAPGLAIDDDALGLTILLPGPPREMRPLFDQQVAPYLDSRLMPGRRPVVRRVLRTTGLAESEVAERVSDLIPSFAPLSIAFLPVGIGIDLRITSRGELAAEDAEAAIGRAIRALRERLGDAVYAEGDTDLAAVLGHALGRARLTVATAESCTGGLVAKRLTDVPGASGWLKAGIVTYSDEAKRDLLGVPPHLLTGHGAVSEPVVRAMAEGVRRATGADCSMAITGVAGPGGGTPAKPVGTVWIAASVRGRTDSRLVRFVGSRSDIRNRSAQAAMSLLLRLLSTES